MNSISPGFPGGKGQAADTLKSGVTAAPDKSETGDQNDTFSYQGTIDSPGAGLVTRPAAIKSSSGKKHTVLVKAGIYTAFAAVGAVIGFGFAGPVGGFTLGILSLGAGGAIQYIKSKGIKGLEAKLKAEIQQMAQRLNDKNGSAIDDVDEEFVAIDGVKLTKNTGTQAAGSR